MRARTALDVAERFPRDVQHHTLAIIQDDGFHRRVRCQAPGTWCMGFDLITWPGHLCYTGDMGTYVFARIPDMFEFFRASDKHPRRINPSYWSEKVLAADKHAGITRFSEEAFKEAVRGYFRDTVQGDDDWHGTAGRDLWRAIEDEVLVFASDGEHCAFNALYEFSHQGTDGRSFRFQDWEDSCTEYSFRFLWCCHALVWAIAAYDHLRAGCDQSQLRAAGPESPPTAIPRPGSD